MRLSGNRKHIFSRDPALARTHLAPDGKEVVDDGAMVDAELKKVNDDGTGALNGLPLKDGRQPVVWELAPLSERAYAELTRTSLHDLQKAINEKGIGGALLDRGTYAEDREGARRGLIGAKGAVGEDGRPLELRFDDAAGGKVLRSESLEELYRCYGPRLIGEIGRRVIDLSELDPL